MNSENNNCQGYIKPRLLRGYKYHPETYFNIRHILVALSGSHQDAAYSPHIDMKAFIAVIFTILAMVIVSAQEAKKENLHSSEAIYFGSPYGAYGTYGAYPYVSAAGYPAVAPAYPPVANGYSAAYPFYR
ncbi:uncharacterized protein LOC110827361 isoform X2 [Zootermopsis nevadensis]|uniref:uncharacterized protein LOC110827361 isoform X2 n=1 Tax=Zootermopsis nevadensis TaxID=136037 RepID=UPI000B8E950E|nr:uncharacterized protein LOC110827361 isoform X2 [Zootermopsis nevadensis]